MHALPPDVERHTEPRPTGLSCPDCFGVLSVVAEGKRPTLLFRCRTGHTYAAHEVVAAKETRLEENVWTAITILDELCRLLRELQPLADHRDCAGAYEERARQAEVQQSALRALLAGLGRTELDSHGDDHVGDR